ncbi:type II toxin-antitoxin system VapC family toxin [Paracraurococcus ruber]|uniref:Ribonuclease VapC n=1 Tax=Paracraurococcus ruber TaxID=77675 RepID=A0ABS1CW18_9PROT|nr:type II toxin-antitoxin system VapC family toxin [Paracraurococcus ruber]MBK1658501.1 VapC toxin family PIN domain ribonuclease [Paracraurococcus ruber]TDG29703.1 type II toxin-antitoxin system VapC family toxin [Paracraurococcus ruber]
MLDTNIVSDLIRNPAGRAAGQVARVGEEALCLSIVTAAELRYGGERSGSERIQARVAAVLARLPVLPFDHPADAEYARLRTALEAAGQVIGPNDMLIAAHALATGATLVTGNTGEFRRVAGLTVEDWVRG